MLVQQAQQEKVTVVPWAVLAYVHGIFAPWQCQIPRLLDCSVQTYTGHGSMTDSGTNTIAEMYFNDAHREAAQLAQALRGTASTDYEHPV